MRHLAAGTVIHGRWGARGRSIFARLVRCGIERGELPDFGLFLGLVTSPFTCRPVVNHLPVRHADIEPSSIPCPPRSVWSNPHGGNVAFCT